VRAEAGPRPVDERRGGSGEKPESQSSLSGCCARDRAGARCALRPRDGWRLGSREEEGEMARLAPARPPFALESVHDSCTCQDLLLRPSSPSPDRAQRPHAPERPPRHPHLSPDLLPLAAGLSTSSRPVSNPAVPLLRASRSAPTQTRHSPVDTARLRPPPPRPAPRLAPLTRTARQRSRHRATPRPPRRHSRLAT